MVLKENCVYLDKDCFQKQEQSEAFQLENLLKDTVYCHYSVEHFAKWLVPLTNGIVPVILFSCLDI